MPRPRLCRRVRFSPGITYFKPAGIQLIELEETILSLEELEAIRLKDLEGLDQGEAAKKMNISQPTFNRLIKSARKKIASSLVKGKAIRISGGHYKMVQKPGIGKGRGLGHGAGFGGPASKCVCIKCDYKIQKQRGVPCADLVCPKCGAPMIREE